MRHICEITVMLYFIFRLVLCCREDVSFNIICLNVFEGIKKFNLSMRFNTDTYNLRRNNSLLVPFIRKEIFSKSFFPKTIREWNNLSLDLKEADSINIFKEKLNGYMEPIKVKSCILMAMVGIPLIIVGYALDSVI